MEDNDVPSTPVEQIDQPQEQIPQDNNTDAQVEIVESAPMEINQQLHEVEEKPHEEDTERGEEDNEKPELEEEVKPVLQDTPLKQKQQSLSVASQDQKIILNDVEADEDKSPTYKDFFVKEKSTPNQSLSKKIERVEGTPNKDSPPRWEQLYERAKLSQEKKKKMKEELDATKKEDPECTFQPKLLASALNVESGDGDPVHKRTRAWRENKDKKLADSREQTKDKDLHGCTFKPDLSRTQGNGYMTQNLSTYGSKGVDLHLKRQVVAKQVKEEKETILDNPLQKLPPHVYKKEGNITIPKGPDFNKGKPIEIHSLKKPFDFPTPKNSVNEPPKKDTPSPQKESKTLVDPVQVSDVKFGEAIQMLHRELHRIKI